MARKCGATARQNIVAATAFYPQIKLHFRIAEKMCRFD